MTLVAGATPSPVAVRLTGRFELNGDLSITDFKGDYTPHRSPSRWVRRSSGHQRAPSVAAAHRPVFRQTVTAGHPVLGKRSSHPARTAYRAAQRAQANLLTRHAGKLTSDEIMLPNRRWRRARAPPPRRSRAVALRLVSPLPKNAASSLRGRKAGRNRGGRRAGQVAEIRRSVRGRRCVVIGSHFRLRWVLFG